MDIQATLLDGKAHDVDSSADTFKLAAIECFRDAQLKAGLVLLEPIMNVVVHAPGQYLGDLTRDVSRRRGEILNTSLDKGRCMLHAYVPLAELFGYTSELRNFTSGTAAFTHGAEPLRPGEGRAGGPAGGELKGSLEASARERARPPAALSFHGCRKSVAGWCRPGEDYRKAGL